MMLGAISPISVDAIKQTITTQQQSPKQVVVNSNQPNYIAPPQTDYLTMLKKYAPYLIGGLILLYILKSKK